MRWKSIFYFLLELFLTVVNGNNERMLVEKLLSYYHRGLIPSDGNASVPIKVQLSLKLIQVFEINKRQVMSTSVWMKQAWRDPNLRWNESEHDGIDEISLLPSDMWVPDIVLLNNAESSKLGKPVGMNNPVLVTSNGTVRWLTPLILHSSCKLNVKYFPFDEQFCRLSFASWTYSGKQLKIEPEETNILQNYTESGEWQMEKVYTLQSTVKPTHSLPVRKAVLTYVITIRRRVFYYFVYLITPCLLTSLLTLVLFTLPPESGERMVVGVTILLSLTVFYLLASSHIPETSEVVPLIGRYYSLTIVEVSLALLLTCCVLRFHHYNTSFGRVPRWVRVYIIGHVARLVRYKVPPQNLQEPSRQAKSPEGAMSESFTSSSKDFNSSLRRRLPNEPSGITKMAERVIKKQEDDAIMDEWQLAARVLNRLFMIVYLVAIFLSLAGIFLQAPGVFTAKQGPHKE